MAGDWIKMRSDLFTHPKVVRIASALKADTLRTVGGLMSVWCLFDVHSIDGRLDGYTTETLDDHLRWTGFAEQMAAVKWLEVSERYLGLPEFDTHNGESAKRRAQDADRKRADRKASASEADKKRTREEKRREEKKEDKPPSVVKRASKKCPADFEISEDMRTWASLECPTVDTAKATAKFRDHTFKNSIIDWAGAWRNWLRKDFEQQGPKGTPGKFGAPAEPAWRTEQRERTRQAAPGVAVKNSTEFFIEMEPANVAANCLG